MYWIARPAHRILDLNKLLATNPRQANLFKERAAQYYRLWNYEQATADYSSSLAILPGEAGALHSRGLAYEQMGQFDRALEDYQQAIASDPQLSDVYIHRGVTFGKMGNFRQSITSLTEGIRLAPQNPDAYFNRGTSYFQLGDLESAIADFSMVIQLSPQDEDAYYWRGISNEEAGRPEEAIADYRQFLAISQNPNAREEIEIRLSPLEGRKQGRVGKRVGDWISRLISRQVPTEDTQQKADLHNLIIALGERAVNSTWFGRGVECYGEKKEELYAFTGHNRPIPGNDFLQLVSGIRQTIKGDFEAFDPGEASPWVFIRAWEGNGFYVETNEPKSRDRLKSYFPSIEKVEGASPPYQGLFIPIETERKI
jgi:tetratricopeptide (TPR) repeat protein